MIGRLREHARTLLLWLIADHEDDPARWGDGRRKERR